MSDEDAVTCSNGGEEPQAERSLLLARIERLERLVLSGDATLDDYGELALAQQEWARERDG